MMKRRKFLSTAVTSIPLLTGTTSGSVSNSSSQQNQSPLNKFDWVDSGAIDVPSDIQEEHVSKDVNWEVSRYDDDHLSQQVKELTGQAIDSQLMSIFTIHISGLDYYITPDSEFDEISRTIDGDAEEAFEAIAEEQMDGLQIGSDFHIKTYHQIVSLTIGQIPYVGEIGPLALDYLWDAPESIVNDHGKTTYLSQYFASRDVNGVDVNYRGLYADWFYEGDLYVVGGFYPEDSESLIDGIKRTLLCRRLLVSHSAVSRMVLSASFPGLRNTSRRS